MKRYIYIVAAFISLVGWIILDNIYSQFKWVALGIGLVMIVFAIFSKNGAKVKAKDEDETEDEDDIDVEDEGVATEPSEDEIEMNIAVDGGTYF